MSEKVRDSSASDIIELFFGHLNADKVWVDFLLFIFLPALLKTPAMGNISKPIQNKTGLELLGLTVLW